MREPVGILIAWLALAPPALACPLRATRGVLLAGGADVQEMRMRSRGATLLTLTGITPILRLGLIDCRPRPLYWRLTDTLGAGPARYQGNPRLGLPAEARSGRRLQEANARIGWRIEAAHTGIGRVVLIPYLSVTDLRFQDAGHAPFADGTLQAGLAGLGVLAALTPARHLVLTLRALFGNAYAAEITESVPTAFAPASGELSEERVSAALGGSYHVLALTLSDRLGPGLRLAVGVQRLALVVSATAPGALSHPQTPVFLPGRQITQTLITLTITHVL